jgi:hypothetical protein
LAFLDFLGVYDYSRHINWRFIAAISGIKGLQVPLAFIILTGTITGITQWVVLRQNIPRVDYWILVNFVGSCLGGST